MLLNILLALLVLWVIMAIFGVAIHGLSTLLWIAVILFIATLIYYLVTRSRGPRL